MDVVGELEDAVWSPKSKAKNLRDFFDILECEQAKELCSKDYRYHRYVES